MRTTKPFRGGERKKLTGTEIELEIDSLSNTGDGVGRFDGRVVFVPYTMPGDRLRATVTTDKRKFLLASLVELLAPSADRIQPPCKVFGQCGGCDWQHIPYQQQLQTKSDQVLDTLSRIGGLGHVPSLPIIVSSDPYFYRNRIQGVIRGSRFFQHRRGSHELVPVDTCHIADKRINEMVAAPLAQQADGDVEIAIVDDQAQLFPLHDRATELGFRQVNTAVSNRLDDLVLEILSQCQCANVYDLYCGRGGWTNRIAENYPALQVTGVDSLSVNIEAATTAASRMALANVTFIHASVEDSLSVLSSKDSVCIVDPPRSGLDSLVTRALCKKRPRDLIYISCHPASLARDLKILTEKAYRIITLQPLDMFPQTSHVECLVYLQSGSR